MALTLLPVFAGLCMLHLYTELVDRTEYNTSSLKPGSRKQFIIFNRIINPVRGGSLISLCGVALPIL